MTAAGSSDDGLGPSDAARADSSPPAEGARRRGRLLSLAGWSVLGIVVLGVAWVIVTGLVARSELEDARSRLASLRTAVTSGNTVQAQHIVKDIVEHTDSAHSLTSGPAWWVAANMPVVGAPLQTTRVIAAQADRLGSDVLPGVVRLLRTVPTAAKSSLSSIDLSAIARAAPQLHRAADTAASAARTIAAQDGSWLPTIHFARDSFLVQLRQLDGELSGADRAVRILLPMLGNESRQRYFVGFLNEAESRGGGGIPGAFAIVTADHGRIRFERFGSDDDLSGVTAPVDLGTDFDARYRGNDPKGTIQNSNLSPDFRYAGQIWAGMWQAKTGERIDGSLAIDPTALSYLLRVTGSARLPGGGVVSADNVVALTEKTQYSRFPATSAAANNQRKAYLTGLARRISTHLTSGAGNPAQLVKAVSRAAGERRFVVWSRSAAVEKQLDAANWAGALGNDRGAPLSAFVVNNAAGSKLDYYLRRSMSYLRTACGPGGTGTATIALTNGAPRSGLPPYVTIRADDAAKRSRPGDNRLLLTYYADRGAKITKFTVNGRPVAVFPLPEGNTLAATTTVEIPANTTAIAVVTVVEPRAAGHVTVLRQPGVTPLKVDLRADRCR